MPITLQDILAAREARAARQEILSTKYQQTLISYTLNIAGPVKRFPSADRCFYTGKQEIEKSLSKGSFSISDSISTDEDTGLEFIWVVDGDPKRLKTALADIEESHPLGRLFDMDVIGPDGDKISREEIGLGQRSCLVCGKSGAGCARSRTHSADEVIAFTKAMIEEYYLKKDACVIAKTAVRSLLYEVSATPKPGLVDRFNNGAHDDMDFFTFIDSSTVLYDYFREMAEIGARRKSEPASELLQYLQGRGVAAEEEMFHATGGINTHKGLIFSLGIICAALGRHGMPFPKPTDILQTAARIAAPALGVLGTLGDNPIAATNETAKTHGETIYARYGYQGVRGEAALGFPSVTTYGLPALRTAIAKGFSLNDAGIAALLSLIANVDDTNIISRSSPEKLSLIQKEVKNFLAASPNQEGILTYASQLDQQLIAEHISPGGSADLLAISYMMFFVDAQTG